MEVVGMTYFRRLFVAVLGAVSLVGAASISVGAHEGGTLVEFDSMTGVSVTVKGTTNDRGITAGGAPWVITSGTGEVDRQGNVHVVVRGLVIPNVGNPIRAFSVTVSCITPHGVMNVTTGPSPANAAGDSTINGTVSLPHPCKNPEVFVGFTRPTGQFIWFAMSNAEEDGD
jgi:hypothetical protein